MTPPDDKRSTSPAERFRNIMSEERAGGGATASRLHPGATPSPAMNLPRPNAQPDGRPHGAAVEPPPPAGKQRAGGLPAYLPAFWTIASIISLVFNIVLVVLVVGLLRSFGSLDARSIGSGVLGGLYSNFERMDGAHIKTTIPIRTSLPLDLTVPVQTTTGITLARDVSIPGAHVRINTPLFNIDAPANVTLPAGTSMEVVIGMSLPVKTDVPVALDVPVDIALQQTDLHPALVGLQDTIQPLYCMLDPMAQTALGEPVCR